MHALMEARGMRAARIMVTLSVAALVLGACGGGGGRGGPPGGGFARGGGPMIAGPQAEPRELQLRRFDADADGTIATAEFEQVLKMDFAGADKNNDGALDGMETRALNDRLLTQREISPVLDWNADGRVSLDEFAAQWRTLFKRADADGDGRVATEELTARMPRGGPSPGGRPSGGPPGQGRPGGGRPGGRE